MPPSAVVERIRKLLNTKGRSPEEAAAFVARAMEMLRAHNLDLAAVEETPEPFGSVRIKSAVSAVWRSQLMQAIAESCDCRLVRVRQAGEFCVVGEPHNIEVVRFLYAYLTREIDRIAEVYWRAWLLLPHAAHEMTMTERQWKHSFRLGATVTIMAKLQEQATRAQQAPVGAEARALLHQRGAALTAYVAQLFPRTSGASPRPTVDRSAAAAGARAGAAVPIHRAVEQAAKDTGRRALGAGDR